MLQMIGVIFALRGSSIQSIKTESQGLVPFLKIANDITAAINRSGKRRSASVVYFEVLAFRY